ncbi:MAG: hypothetical protein KL787_09950 [Taibaiella sp.]|nr:hypothetical protein [Taibaiella sp.]
MNSATISFEAFISVLSILSGTLIAVLTIFYSNRNTKKQITTSKLEELYQLLQRFSQKYYKIQELSYLADGYLERKDSLSKFYEDRDRVISASERKSIENDLGRLELLIVCYTKEPIKKELLNLKRLINSFFAYSTTGWSIDREVYYKNGFPHLLEFYKRTEILKGKLEKAIQS